MGHKFQGRTTHHQVDGNRANSQEHGPPECKRKNYLLRPDGKPSAANRASRVTLYQLGYEWNRHGSAGERLIGAEHVSDSITMKAQNLRLTGRLDADGNWRNDKYTFNFCFVLFITSLLIYWLSLDSLPFSLVSFGSVVNWIGVPPNMKWSRGDGRWPMAVHSARTMSPGWRLLPLRREIRSLILVSRIRWK